MSLAIHNYTWRGVRLVQIETQPNHLDGILDIIQDVRRSSSLDWEDIYSANYECEEDGTVTFYEGESVEAGSPGVWTYVVYDCLEGEEEVVRNSKIDVLATLLKVQQGIEERKASVVNLGVAESGDESITESLEDSFRILQNHPVIQQRLNLLPYAQNGVVDIRKLRDYCLSSEHDDGRHKARLFSSILGMTADNAEELRQILLEAIKTHEAQLGRRDGSGQRYTLDFTIEWQNRRAILRSGWIIEHGSEIPRLTTCYPL